LRNIFYKIESGDKFNFAVYFQCSTRIGLTPVICWLFVIFENMNPVFGTFFSAMQKNQKEIKLWL